MSLPITTTLVGFMAAMKREREIERERDVTLMKYLLDRKPNFSLVAYYVVLYLVLSRSLTLRLLTDLCCCFVAF